MAKEELVYVNSEKLSRARDIVALVEGKRSLKKASEQDVKTFWAEKIEAESPKDAVRFVYEGLGGLIRTHAEEAKVRATAKAGAKKGKGKK